MLIRNYENDLDHLLRQQKQRVEREEALQEGDLRTVSKKLSAEHVSAVCGECLRHWNILIGGLDIFQEKELKAFKEALKMEQKQLKLDCDATVPKSDRKEVYRAKREKLDQEQVARVS